MAHGLLFALVLRVAAEDARAALGRLGDAGRLVRPDDLHAEEPRDVGHAFAGHERLQQIVAFGEAARDERGADAAPAGFDVDANAAEAVLDRLDLFDLALIERLRVDLAADVAGEHLGAVDRDGDRVLVLEPAVRIAAQLGARDRRDVQVDLVGAVGREVVLDEQAVARAERQAVDVRRAQPALGAIVGARRRGRFLADGQDADVARRGDVLLDVRRRDAQHLGDVVEAFARHVGRQHRARVDAHAEQLLDGRRVLGAVHAMQRDAAGLGPARRGRLVEMALERRDERVRVFGVGPRLAGRRHEAAAQLADDLLEDFGLGGDVGGRHGLERQLAGGFGVVVAVGAEAAERLDVLRDGLLGRRLRAAGEQQRRRRATARPRRRRAGASSSRHSESLSLPAHQSP